jgi:hypothetical protein
LRRINIESNTYGHGSKTRNLPIILTSTSKPLVLLVNVYTLSSTKLEIRAKQYLLGSEEVGERGRGWGEEGSNDPIIICTYE